MADKLDPKAADETRCRWPDCTCYGPQAPNVCRRASPAAAGVEGEAVAWLCTYIPTGDSEAIVDEATATMRSEMLLDGAPVWVVKNLYAAPFRVSDDDPDFIEPDSHEWTKLNGLALKAARRVWHESESIAAAIRAYLAERVKENK